MGAWIETTVPPPTSNSAPVAPPVGAWIETTGSRQDGTAMRWVAPPVGAWIETFARESEKVMKESLPPWERGLKQAQDILDGLRQCRSPRGSVD